MAEPLPLAVLISGGGTTLKNLLERIAQDRLVAAVRLVISSNPDAGGLRWAAEHGVPCKVVQRNDCRSAHEFSEAVFQPCRDAQVSLVAMGGSLKHVLIPRDFEGRVMNIHPSLIPAFCGKGFYGERVHQAALDAGVKLSGCTVHFVDNQFDHGPIIVQRAVPVLDDDTPHSLAARVFTEECEAFPEAIRLFAEGRLTIVGNRVRIRE